VSRSAGSITTTLPPFFTFCSAASSSAARGFTALSSCPHSSLSTWPNVTTSNCPSGSGPFFIGSHSRVDRLSPASTASARARFSAGLLRSAAVTSRAPASIAANASGPGPLPRSSTEPGRRGSSPSTWRPCA
jgi:hypothetical protein